MRGDRPRHPCRCCGHTRATPHARGSTEAYKREERAGVGYPACAGIDLWITASVALLVRLPRMRGDRPRLCSAPPGGGRATPHARGSTSPASANAIKIAGYPACAGIDLDRVDVGIVTSRLPRMRGDRPLQVRWDRPAGQAPPHARGSTASHIDDPRTVQGYPACAGIDPAGNREEDAGEWLPRMRGDRPRLGICPKCALTETYQAL